MKINWPRLLMFIFILCFLATDNRLRSKVFGPTEVHKVAYVSNSFDDEDFALIQQAADEWKAETHGLATIEIVRGYDNFLYKRIEEDQSSMVIVRASVWNPAILALDARLHTTILGYFFDQDGAQSIIVVPGRMQGEDYYRAVITHEMGHSLALNHLEVENTIMYPSMDMSAYHLTKKNIDWFCRVYYCDSSKLGGI